MIRLLDAEFVRFVIAGATTFVLDYGGLYICTDVLEWHYLWSSAASFTTAVIVNYIICIIWVFKNAGKQTYKKLLWFVGTSFIGLLLNQLCMKVLVDGLEVYYMESKLVSTAIVMIWNYFTKKMVLEGN